LLPFALGTKELLWMILPFALLWAFSPRIAQIISLPIAEAADKKLNDEDRRHLRLIARKTWRFFETFVDKSHHFLPPDNFQEIPEPVVARRTSPTNIGLYLLSVVSANDFGWIGVSDTVEKIEATLSTVQKMTKHHGHLFNWYDTKEIKPLEPRYVSTVDSGNLAGHLWTVARACRQMSPPPFLGNNAFEGFTDTVSLITESASSIGMDSRTEAVTSAQLEEALAALRTSLLNVPVSLSEWNDRLEELETRSITLVDIAKALSSVEGDDSKIELLSWTELLLRQVRSHRKDFRSGPLAERLRAIADSCDQMVQDMKFDFLFDPVKKMFSIGYQAAEHKLDAGFYDLLTSEARLASFVAIAKGDVPATHWFRLARSLISVNHVLTLVSWSGSMFEYLMPLLIMRSPANSLLDQTCRHVVRRQIAYGAERGVPWGVSESAYNVRNLHHTYQYSNFGVPGLGLKQGLSEDLVIAPYATALAAMIEPKEAARNFRALDKLGGQGKFGFFESLDFTADRLPENQSVSVVKAYMAHHQGMTLISLANVLHDGIFCDRFHAEPRVLASDLLLQERMPRSVTVVRVRPEKTLIEPRISSPLVLRRFDSPHEAVPRTHLLSNGRYSVMMTAAGSGYSRWRDIAVTRWREDTTRDASGTYLFLRDVESGLVWSAGYQPTATEPESYKVDFLEDRAEISRRDGSIETTLDVVVSPEDDAEIRLVTLKNTGSVPRVIDVTSYAEMVLAPQAADLTHPAFSNLFVHTEFVPAVNGLLCTRRPRSSSESSPWVGHVLVVEGESVGAVQYESNRTRFLGRGRRIHTPMCVIDGKPLSNNAGAVIDPIVSLRCRVRIPAGESVRTAFTTVIASSREEAMGLADKY
ncbi:MAG TPA: glucoamylase family protein, partial [Candidatus Omnitrophota bacterium]|nr:glucoamylase family protein [Candidatus Omnitrophota bacterium]